MVRSLFDVSGEDLKGKNLSDLMEGMFLILLNDRAVVDENYRGPLRDAYLLYKREIASRESDNNFCVYGDVSCNHFQA